MSTFKLKLLLRYASGLSTRQHDVLRLHAGAFGQAVMPHATRVAAVSTELQFTHSFEV